MSGPIVVNGQRSGVVYCGCAMKYLGFIFALLLACTGVHAAEAATVSVCASGCDYATVSDAALFSGPGDTIQVNGGGGSPYNPATETFNISLTFASTTLQCINGAVIGQANPTGSNALFLTTSSTVTGCTFSNVELRVGPSASVSGIIIAGNTFSASATGTIRFAGEARHFSILNNTNVGGIEIAATSSYGLIEGNTVYGRSTLSSGNAAYFLSSVSSSQLTVRNNVFNSYVTTTSDTNVTAVVLKGEDITFVTNTIRMVNTPPSAFIGTLGVHASGTVNVSGNKLDSPIRGAGTCTIITVSPSSDVPWSQSLTMRNNTLRGRCDDAGGMNVTDNGYTGPISITANISRNAIYGSSAGAGLRFVRGIGSAFSITNTDNGVYGFAATLVNASASNVTQGTGYKTTNPILRTDDADTTNDLEIAPFSDYLDYSGTNDIGATVASRRTTIYVDDDGTVDYSAVDANALTFVTSTLRSGDTLSLAAGTYPAFYVSSTTATTSLTIAGAGAGTVVDAQSNQNALRLTSVTSSAVTGLVLQNASSTSYGYIGTRMGFAYAGDAYDEASVAVDVSASSTLLVSAGCSITIYDEDGTNFASFVGDATSDVNIALLDTGDGHLTALVRNDVASSGGALSTLCGGMLTASRFVTSAFTASGGVYTYQSATVAGAGLTLTNGVTTPAITRTTTSYAGLKLDEAGGITVTGVTSTRNGYGVWFASGGGNSVVDSVLSSSVLYDAYQAATVATNTLDNVSFTRASSTVDALAKPLLVKYRVRAYLTRFAAPAVAVSSTTVTASDAADDATSLGSSGADGYTSYVRLPAYTITNTSNALTNGGYNPYTFAASGGGGFSASTTSETVSTTNQTIAIRMVSSEAPAPPAAAAADTITATSAVISWSDLADTESAFVFDYTTTTLGLTFPGTVSVLDPDSTTVTISGLLPNLGYRARVASRNDFGDSAYSTTAEFRTLAAVPGAPSLTALSGTTASVALSANGNSTSTEFVLYTSTAGKYVDATGALSSTPAWQTTSTWAGTTLTGLTCGTTYSFLSVARNAENTETVSSTAATVTTSVCSSGGGGGGGAVGSGSSGSILAPISTVITAPVPVTTPPVLPPIEVTFLDGLPTPPTADPASVPTTILPPASAASLRLVESDARAFQVVLPAADRERFAAFIDAGTTAETRSLGAGERRALLRDALQTIGRASLPIADLERLARGQIPTTRNLEGERAQLPRARTTFRTIYGRDPDFRNPEENLAWNTLMYRIRFPRDLALERQGIQEFRATFRRDPQDPFQWAVVRALGYVQR